MIWIAECIKVFSATEFVDMFPRTNGDILVHAILVWDRFLMTDINPDLSSHVETVCLLSRK